MMIDRVIQNATLMLSNIVNFDEEMDFFKKYKLKSIKDDESSTGGNIHLHIHFLFSL